MNAHEEVTRRIEARVRNPRRRYSRRYSTAFRVFMVITDVITLLYFALLTDMFAFVRSIIK